MRATEGMIVGRSGKASGECLHKEDIENVSGEALHILTGRKLRYGGEDRICCERRRIKSSTHRAASWTRHICFCPFANNPTC